MIPLISTIIPTFNRCEFLMEAVRSVLNQTDENLEIIVVDDGSTDDTQKNLAPLFNRIKYVYQENKGPASARNRGIYESRGELIAFLDSDDLWMPEKLKKQRQLFEKDSSLMIAHTDEIWLRNGVRVNQMKKHKKAGGDIFERSLDLCLVSPSAVMMRRMIFDAVGLWDDNLPFAEDYDLWLRILSRYPIGFIPEPLTIKRGGHPDQQSKKFVGGDKYRIFALEKILDSGVLTEHQRDLVINAIKKKCLIYGKGCIKHGKLEEGRKYLSVAEKYT